MLDSDVYTKLPASPRRLSESIPSSFKQWVIIDEIQKISALLDEVHIKDIQVLPVEKFLKNKKDFL